jgi:hypothetical protein
MEPRGGAGRKVNGYISEHFDTDPDPRIRTTGLRIPDPALFFSGFKVANKNKFLPPVLLIFNYIYILYSLQRLQIIKKP